MSDNVISMDDHRDPQLPNLVCTGCGSQWWNLAVVVSGNQITGRASQVECRDCGHVESLVHT